MLNLMNASMPSSQRGLGDPGSGIAPPNFAQTTEAAANTKPSCQSLQATTTTGIANNTVERCAPPVCTFTMVSTNNHSEASAQARCLDAMRPRNDASMGSEEAVPGRHPDSRDATWRARALCRRRPCRAWMTQTPFERNPHKEGAKKWARPDKNPSRAERARPRPQANIHWRNRVLDPAAGTGFPIHP